MAGVDVEQSLSEPCCVLCCDEIDFSACGSCDHPICLKCCVKLRLLRKEYDCPVCRAHLKEVIVSEGVKFWADKSKRSGRKNPLYDHGIVHETSESKKQVDKLLQHRCPECNQVCRSFPQVKDHVRKEHSLLYCDICLRHLKLFTYERKCYTRAELVRHRKEGDVDDRSHRGHPLCHFCDERYLDNDELLVHLRKNHFWCHLCEKDGSQDYYPDYKELRQHFKQSHYLCEEGKCLHEKFTSVFRIKFDYQAHIAQTHSDRLSKAEARKMRQLDINITFARREDTENIVSAQDFNFPQPTSERRSDRSRNNSKAMGSNAESQHSEKPNARSKNEREFRSRTNNHDGRRTKHFGQYKNRDHEHLKNDKDINAIKSTRDILEDDHKHPPGEDMNSVSRGKSIEKVGRKTDSKKGKLSVDKKEKFHHANREMARKETNNSTQNSSKQISNNVNNNSVEEKHNGKRSKNINLKISDNCSQLQPADDNQMSTKLSSNIKPGAPKPNAEKQPAKPKQMYDSDFPKVSNNMNATSELKTAPTLNTPPGFNAPPALSGYVNINAHQGFRGPQEIGGPRRNGAPPGLSAPSGLPTSYDSCNGNLAKLDANISEVNEMCMNKPRRDDAIKNENSRLMKTDLITVGNQPGWKPTYDSEFPTLSHHINRCNGPPGFPSRPPPGMDWFVPLSSWKPSENVGRSQIFLNEIRHILNLRGESFEKFQQINKCYREEKISPIEYFQQCCEMLGKEKINKFFGELIDLLPDEAKRKELLLVYNDAKVKAKLENACVVTNEGLNATENELPNLGSISPNLPEDDFPALSKTSGKKTKPMVNSVWSRDK